MRESRIVRRGRALARFNKFFAAAVVATLVAGLAGGISQAAHPEVSLPGSNFEIDGDANVKVDDPSPSIDWANVAESRQNDKPTGATDDSFKASKESEADPIIESGSIPNNKSDLKAFGIYQETTATKRFLHMFWTRVQDPSGTTNMDFEFNKKACPPDCSANGITPKRTSGDLLVTYDLDRGGVVPTISLRTWNGSDWGPETNLTSSGQARGSINTTAIPAADADGLGMLGARTFGEASIDLSIIFDSTKCDNFGSAYLKSRSSTPITAELKDFVAPKGVRIGNCGSIKIKKTDNGAPPHNLAGAEFTLHKDVAPIGGSLNPATDVAVTPAKTCTTAANGECVISDVFAGTYWLVETVTPAGYETADPQAVTVTADEEKTLTFVDVFIPLAKIAIAPAMGANQIGDDHVLTVTVMKQGVNDAGFVAASGATVKVAIDSGPGSFKNGDDECTTNASGQCSVTLVSSVTGLTTVSAKADVPVDAKIVKVETNGQNGSSGPAKKHWIDVQLTLTPPQDANRVNDTHMFTAHLKFDTGSGFVNAPAGKTISFTLAGPGSLSATTCTTGAGGTCTVDLQSGVTGLSKVVAAFNGAVSTAEGNAAATASSDEAKKQWVDVKLDLTPESAVNRVGDPHTFTAHLQFDKGDGNGFVNASGEQIDFTKSGAGSLSAGSCTTGATGTCTVVLTSTVTGTSSVQASWDGDVVTANGTVSTTQTDTATKDWVDALITINPPQDTNEIGDDHIFTIAVFKKVNGVTSPAAGIDAKASIVSGPGAFAGGDDTCTTNANGECTVTITSNTTGITTVKAEATIVVDGKTIVLATDGSGGNTSPAKKRWVAARLSLTPPEDANQVGDTHTFTAHLEFDKGDANGFVDAPAGEQITFAESGPGTLVSAGCTTVAGGTCNVELNSSQTGLSTVTATWDGDVTTAEGTAAMDAKTDTALKRWVDARLSLTPPEAANQVGDDHTFIAHLEFDTGSGFVDAPAGKVIDVAKVSGPGSLSASSCTTDANGECTVVGSSNTTGLMTVEASWNGTVATSEGTANASAGPDEAVKRWVDVRLSLTPPEAANQVGDDHTFTAHLEFDTGNGFVDAPAGKTIDVTKVSGPGTLSASSCTTDANGECSVELSSSATGLTTVEASFDGTVSTAQGSASASADPDQAVKRWADARLSLTPPEAANRVGDTHTFTAHLEFDEGDGNGFANAPAGEQIDFTEVGPGTLSAASCTTVAGGTCSVDLDSPTLTGLSTVEASWSGGIATAEGTAQAAAAPDEALKRWIDVKLDLTPESAVNRVGDPHTFTAHLQFDMGDGNGFVDAPAGETIDLSKTGVGTLSAASCTTAADGTCTVVLTSTETGSTDVTASWDGIVATTNGVVNTSESDTAEKEWVDALILINPPQATNEVGDDHVYTISVQQKVAGVASPAAGVDVSASITSGPGAFVGDDGCTTDANGECTVTINSTSSGLTVVEAEATVSVNGEVIVLKTDGVGSNAAPATKRWVDARLSVTPPEATNLVGDTHTFTAHLEIDNGDGNGFVDAAAGETISFAKTSGPGAFVDDTCLTAADGTCTVDLDSSTAGTTEIEGTWNGTVTTAEGSATLTRADTATKLWIDPSIQLVKTADPILGGPRNVTYTYVVTNIGDNTLTDVLVTDDILGDIGTIDVLEPGKSETLERTVFVDTDSPTHNIGEACGTHALGGQVCDTDDADIVVVLGVVELPKTGFGMRLWLLWAGALLGLGAAALTLEETLRRRRPITEMN